ncbi:MAG: DNA polymerase III subunit beta [Gammaproteobacteria bacterium]|nr:DNA polymerase III subunit beta [Gammaproteobacteria bacterium]
MRFTIQRETLLKPLQRVSGVVERRQTMPILSNFIIDISDQRLSIIGSDLEIELVASLPLEAAADDGVTTVSARKLLDICKILPDGASVEFSQDGDTNVVMRSGKSRFMLATLPADTFPSIKWDTSGNQAEFSIKQGELRSLIESTQFAMAQQDVRHYLNGLFLELKKGMLWAVAADGHRMALNGVESPVANGAVTGIIVPRKGVLELMRLLDDSDKEVQVTISNNHIRVVKPGLVYTSKLIDGAFPDYEKTIPKNGDKEVVIDRELFKQALSRVAILSSDMFCGVHLQIQSGLLRMATRSSEQEEAEEEIAIEYQGDEVSIGFNINYLLDILNNVDAQKIKITLKNGDSSVLIEEHEGEGEGNSLYVVMPLRL